MAKVVWPHDRQTRVEWKAALGEVRNVWADCYLDRGHEIELERLVDNIAQPVPTSHSVD